MFHKQLNIFLHAQRYFLTEVSSAWDKKLVT